MVLSRQDIEERGDRPALSKGSAAETGTLQDGRGWLLKPVTPWRRYGARMIDTTVHGFLCFLSVAVAWYIIAPESADWFFARMDTPAGALLDLILTTFFAAVVGSFVVGATGSSLGKVIFGVRVVDYNFRPIGVGKGLAREFRVWGLGLGFGIPLVSLITLILAYQSLKKDGATPWDSGRYLVLHRPNGSLQYVLNVVGIVLIIALIIGVRALNSL